MIATTTELTPEHFDACYRNGDILADDDRTGQDYRWSAVAMLRKCGLFHQPEDAESIRVNLRLINANRKIVVLLRENQW